MSALRQALETAYHGRGVLTVPFTDRSAGLPCTRPPVQLSKAGGISRAPGRQLGVPLVNDGHSRRGTENAAFFARHGLSFFGAMWTRAARFADWLIYDPACAERMLAAGQPLQLPRDGAEQIAAAITA